MTQELIFDAIGTSWRIVITTLQEDLSDTNLSNLNAKLTSEIFAFIAEYDHWYSRFKPNSFITKVATQSTQPGSKTYTLPNHSEPLFELYQTLFELSGELFTACIGHALEQTGYDARYSLKPQKLIETPPSFEVVDFSPAKKTTNKKNEPIDTHSPGQPKLSIPHCSSPLVLDFGAAGKGYLVDLIGALILQKAPKSSWFINAGGDILHHATLPKKTKVSTKTTAEAPTIKPIIIGLEHPLDTTKIIGSVPIQNQSICGSAGNRRKWGRFYHILNPQTKTSPEHILATWVIADSGLLADGLATALYFVSPEKLKTKFDFEYVILYTDGTVETSQNFSGHLYT